MFYRIATGTTTIGDVYLVAGLIFFAFIIGMGIGAFVG